MKAIVRKVNYRRGMVVFEKEDGDYGYFEILDSVDLEEEDILRGDFDSLGGITIVKISTDEKIDICVEDFGMSYKNAMARVFN